MRLLVFPTVLAAIVHVYLWRRLVRDLELSLWQRRIATIVLGALFASIPLTLWSVLFLARTGSSNLALFGFGWASLTIYLTALLVAWDVASGLQRRLRKTQPRAAQENHEPPPPAAEPPLQSATPPLELAPRRVFVARAVAGSALLATGAVGVFGVRSAWDIITPEIQVRLPRLPRALDGYTIALLTDIHIGPVLGGEYLRQLVEQTNRLKPDLIAIGGDVVDGMVGEIGSQVAELRRLSARDGVFLVTGNHEYYSDPVAWIQFFERLGIRVLDNQHVTAGDPAGGARFDLAGIPDRMGARFGDEPDVVAATQARDPDRALVMLAHQPVQIYESVKVGAGLQLSGHTHGGQLMPFGMVARLRQPYIAGLHQHPGTDTQIYVSCGSGFWGPPLRVFAPAEISVIRLVSA